MDSRILENWEDGSTRNDILFSRLHSIFGAVNLSHEKESWRQTRRIGTEAERQNPLFGHASSEDSSEGESTVRSSGHFAWRCDRATNREEAEVRLQSIDTQ